MAYKHEKSCIGSGSLMGSTKRSALIAISIWILSFASWVLYNSPDFHSFDEQSSVGRDPLYLFSISSQPTSHGSNATELGLHELQYSEKEELEESQQQGLELKDDEEDGHIELDEESESSGLEAAEVNAKDNDGGEDGLMRGHESRGSLKSCATVEEMGSAAVGRTYASSMKVRRLIQDYMAEHGASHVRELSSEQFCSRGFVYGRATEDGFGNDMYKILTAAGLSIMLNRSLIIGEHGSTNPAYLGLTGRVRLPFGDYIQYSEQTFTLREVKRLWTIHDCTNKYKRPLFIRVDDFQKPRNTRSLCDDWTTSKDPIIWYKGTTDSVALQFFLKNKHPAMRSQAILLMGNPSTPDSRSNLFGELLHSFISPMPIIEDAIQWTLQGNSSPDISLHLRMLNSRSRRALNAASRCICKVLENYSFQDRLPLVVVVSDTPVVIEEIEKSLKGTAQVLHFDYALFLRSFQNVSKTMSASYFQPPEKRKRDWGSMPRWVALVEFFLASRAKFAVVSGGNRRVSTTYAQLLAALAAARGMDEDELSFHFKSYSSFQYSLLSGGLSQQRGWGHSWRRFGGSLSCINQTRQCAETPLLPYAWWDGPWQSPVPRDIQKLMAYGLTITKSGYAIDESLKKTCESRKASIELIKLQLPSCQKLKSCSY